MTATGTVSTFGSLIDHRVAPAPAPPKPCAASLDREAPAAVGRAPGYSVPQADVDDGAGVCPPE